MSANAKKIYLFLVAALALVIATELVLMSTGVPEKPKDPLAALWAGQYVKEAKRWKESIDELGVSEAYELFKKDGEGKAFGVQHTFAHIFGELIYDKEGVRGIAFCDPTFSFGCYHSLAGKAIIEGGLSIVKDLDGACNEALGGVNTGCLHGIGHGILGYVGYDNLDPALEACRETSWKEPLGGCPGGVFMEYNFHTMETVDRAKARDADLEDLYAPCDTVKSEFRQECYYYQALWWTHVTDEDFGQVAALCSKVPDASDRRACFFGLGESASSRTEYDPSRTKAICDAVPDSGERLWCREGAWKIYYADTRTRPLAPHMCEDLAGGCSTFKI